MKIPQLNLKRLHNEIKSEIDSAILDIFDKSTFIGGHEVEKFEHNFSLLSGDHRTQQASHWDLSVMISPLLGHLLAYP